MSHIKMIYSSMPQSPAVGNPILKFTAATTKEMITGAEHYEREYVVECMISLAEYLLGVVEHDTVFGKGPKSVLRASLYTLYNRLVKHGVPLTPITPLAKSTTFVKTLLGKSIVPPAKDRPLFHFEDIFYALIARMLEMQSVLNVWLSSKFIELDSRLFENGPSIKTFHDGLVAFWNVFNEPSFLGALDHAVRGNRVYQMAQNCFQMVEEGKETIENAEPWLLEILDRWDEIDGLQIGVLTMAPAMINVYLQEKYQLLLHMEKQHRQLRLQQQQKARQARILATQESKRKDAKNARRFNTESRSARKGLSRVAIANRNAQLAKNVEKSVVGKDDINNLADRMDTSLHFSANANIDAGMEDVTNGLSTLQVDTETLRKLEGKESMDLESEYGDKRQNTLHEEIEEQLRLPRASRFRRAFQLTKRSNH